MFTIVIGIKKYNNMTKEEKQLLIQDLCARLPYGVIVANARGYIVASQLECIDLNNLKYDTKRGINLLIEDCRPYLRPMESMTEEELKEFVSFTSQSMHRFICESTNTDHWYNAYEEEDWLLAHHFDYRGLIEKGLALEAPEGMYDLNQ